MRQRLIAFTLAAATILPCSACVPKHLGGINGPVLLQIFFILKIFGLAKKPAPRTLKPTLSNVDLKADVTGVPTGGYDITLGTYGHFTGTQKIVRQRFATVKVKDTDQLKATVAAMLKDALGGEDVTVTKASAKISTHETAGGAQAIFSGKITYVATVTSGVDMGATVKGRMTASGKF